MKILLTALSWLVLLLQCMSFWFYLYYFKSKTKSLASLIRKWLVSALLVHTSYLAIFTYQTGHLPVGDTFQVLTTSAWFFAIVYIILEIRLKEMTMGVFFLPVIIPLQAISNFFIDMDKPLATVLTELTFEVHVALMISAYAAFTISFITSVMYLLLAREMQQKKLGIFFERLPSLDFFDRLSNQAVNIGVILVSAGIILGVMMGVSVWEGKWVFDPKLFAVFISWTIYFTHIITRRFMNWQGRQAAIVSVVGFSWLLFSFIIVTTFLSKIHNFQ